MAFVLKLYREKKDSGSTSTTDFLAAPTVLEDGGLEIGAPKKTRRYSTARLASGGYNIVDSYDENREITIKLRITGATRDAVAATISSISAAINSTEIGDRVALEYMWDGMNDPTFFAVISGHVTLPGNTMSVENITSQVLISGVSYYVIYGVEVVLEVLPLGTKSRVSSAATWTELPLTNNYGSSVTGGITIDPYFLSSGPKNNFVRISGANILGDSPSPIKLTISKVGSTYYHGVVAGVQRGSDTYGNWWGTIDSAEIAQHAGTYSVDTSDPTNMIGGSIAIETVNNGFSGAMAARWDLSTTLTDYIAGVPFRVFGIAYGTNNWKAANAYFIKVIDPNILTGSNIVTETRRIVPSASTNILDFGTLFIPSSYDGASSLDLYLYVAHRTLATGTTNLSIDALVLIPQELGFRFLYSPFAATTLYDDGLLYPDTRVWSASRNDGVGMHSPIKLYPGVDHTIHFLPMSTLASAPYLSLATTYTIKVHYNPSVAWVI